MPLSLPSSGGTRYADVYPPPTSNHPNGWGAGRRPEWATRWHGNLRSRRRSCRWSAGLLVADGCRPGVPHQRPRTMPSPGSAIHTSEASLARLGVGVDARVVALHQRCRITRTGDEAHMVLRATYQDGVGTDTQRFELSSSRRWRQLTLPPNSSDS